MKKAFAIVLAAICALGLLTACSTGTQPKDAAIVIPAEAASIDRVLPDLPAKATYEDIIGELPDTYYLEMSQNTLALMSRMLDKTFSEMTIAETPSVTYFRINADGVLMEIVDENESLFVRKGGKGSFSTIDTDDNADAYKQMTDGLAEMVNGMRLQYSFDRDDFAEIEVTPLRFNKVAGRDCIVYNLAYEDVIDMMVCLDFDTKLCLKLADSINDNVDIEFSVFKTSGFSIPKYK